MNKDLESIYREAFNSSQIDAEDWNLPSDSVWENIEEEIKPKKKRRILWFWLPMACLAMSFYIFQTFPNKNRNMSLEKQSMAQVAQIISTQNDLSSSAQINSDAVRNIDITTEAQKTQNDKLLAERKSNSPKQVKENNRKQGLTNINEVKEQNITINKNVLNPNIQENKTTIAVSPTNEVSAKINPTILKDSVEFCKILPILALQELDKKEQKPDLYIPKQLIKPYKPKNLQLIADAYLLNIRNKTTSGIASSTDFSGEKLRFAYQTGLAIRQSIGKFIFVELGAQYQALQYRLQYEMGLPFNGIGEMENSKGNYDNTYNGAVSTSIGELRMQMVLERQLGHSVPQGEIIPLSAEGEARLSFLRLPIAFGFNKALNSRFSINSKALFSQNININHKAQFRQVLSHHSAVKETLTEVLEAPKPKTWVPEFGFGVGVEYRLTSKWSIKADAIGIQSIKSIYQTSDFTNKHQYLGLGLGIAHRM